MKKNILITVLILLTSYTIAQTRVDTLTNEKVIKLSKIGLQPSTIINKIQNSFNLFDVSPDGLTQLYNNAIALEVVNEMKRVSNYKPPVIVSSLQPKIEILTNENIIQLTKIGLDKSVIISKINSSQTSFDVSTDALINLGNNHVATEVISEMIKLSLGEKKVVDNKSKPPVVENENFEKVASNGNYRDVIYLKNGSIIRGTIVEQIPGKSIKIETGDKSIFVYQLSEIDKLTKEEIIESKQSSPISNSSNNKTGLKKGYEGSVCFGYEFMVGGSSEPGQGFIKFNFINGYRTSPYFAIGLGVGVRYCPWAADEALIPIFLDAKINFLNKPVSPYLSIDFGGNIYVPYTEYSGLIFNPTVGVCVKTGSMSSFNFGFGYNLYYFAQAGIGNTLSLNLAFTF